MKQKFEDNIEEGENWRNNFNMFTYQDLLMQMTLVYQNIRE